MSDKANALVTSEIELSKMTLQLLTSGSFPGTHAPLISSVWAHHVEKLEDYKVKGEEVGKED